MRICEARYAPWLPKCKNGGKTQMGYEYVRKEFIGFIGRTILYGEGGWECPECGFKIESADLPKHSLSEDGYMDAYAKEAEKTLWKNYPPDKYEYISVEELFRQYPAKFDRSSLGYLDKLVYCMHQDGELRVFKKSAEVLMSKDLLYGRFNLALPEDFPANYKANDTEELLEYLHPDYTKYLSEPEAVERVKREFPYWFNKRHMDFFTHNLIYPGEGIYLRSLIHDYTCTYWGIFYPLDIHVAYMEFDPDEYDQDRVRDKVNYRSLIEKYMIDPISNAR